MRWLRPALLMAGLVGAGWLLQRVGLSAAVAQAGERGPLVFVGVAAAACAVGVPRQVVAYAGGLAFGFWAGAGMALAATVAGCAADFWWARGVARDWAARVIGRSARAGRMERFLVAHAFRATLTLRLMPVGSNILLNLLGGVSGVAAGPFLLASALGYVPQTTVFALLGGGVRVSQGAQVGLAAVLMAGSVALGVGLMRGRVPAPPPSAQPG